MGNFFLLLSVLIWSNVSLCQEATLRIANSKEPESLDPVLMDGVEAQIVGSSLFEGLVVRDPKTAMPVPGSASSWEISEDGKSYTFKIRSTARWSDGVEVKASDFVNSWKRALDPKSKAYYGTYLDGIVGAKEWRLGNAAIRLGLEVVDPKTFRVKLNNPDNAFLDKLTSPVFFPVRLDLISNQSSWARPGMISNGPFILKSWKLNQSLDLIPNPYYWDYANLKLTKVQFFTVPDAHTALQMYDNNEVDWVSILPLGGVEKLKERPDFTRSPEAGTVYLRFNLTFGPLRIKEVRQAISLSINRSIIAEKFAREGQKAAFRFVSPGIPGYPETRVLEEDVEKARALLAKAGFPRGKGFPPMQLLFISDPQSQSVATALSSMLKQNLGIAISPVNLEKGSYYDRLDGLSFHLARSMWRPQYLDPMNFLDKFTSANTWQNLTGYKSADYDDLISRARIEKNIQEQAKILDKAERLLIADDAVIVPLYYNVSTNLWRPTFTGFFHNALDIHPLKAVAPVLVTGKK